MSDHLLASNFGGASFDLAHCVMPQWFRDAFLIWLGRWSYAESPAVFAGCRQGHLNTLGLLLGTQHPAAAQLIKSPKVGFGIDRDYSPLLKGT